MGDDLDQLFSAIPRTIAGDLGDLSSTLNVSNFYLWQMATTVNMNIDTGVSSCYLLVAAAVAVAAACCCCFCFDRTSCVCL